MAKTLILSNIQWKKLFAQIKEDIGPKALISWVLKRDLGFSVRSHQSWDAKNYEYIYDTRLDFYDDELQTVFILKYGHYLVDKQDS